ncbi:MAG: sigma-70 family RNA polymerase sigma factor [Ruminococcaceae bacterium]|nr:sigma-70 family RNA polymerase sigma factor [Oscillospiraceae bacterium]
MPNADENLVISARDGDAEAFGCLYEKFKDGLYKYAYYMLGNPEDAQDVVMDTVIDAFAGIKKLREPNLFKNWIFKILYNKIKMKRKGYIVEKSFQLEENLTKSNENLEIETIEREDLLRALSKLEEEDRSIVLLSVNEGYSSKDIGEMIGMNSNTVRTRLKRALDRMRLFLEIEEGGYYA